jgi:hypothetical protein
VAGSANFHRRATTGRKQRDGFATPRHQFIESTDALCIEADDFAVDNSALYQHLPERFLQGRERLELIPVAGDKLALGGVDVGERPEACVSIRRRSRGRRKAWRPGRGASVGCGEALS